MSNPYDFYKSKIEENKEILDKLEKTLVVYSSLRLAIVVICIGSLYFLYKSNNIIGMVGSFLVSLLVFLVIAFFHNNKLNEKKKLTILLEYNENGLKRINGEWKSFEDLGEEYINKEHRFSKDLDVFGKNSLFQWINTTNTLFGRKALADKLNMNCSLNRLIIDKEQQAVQELSQKREFATKLFVDSYELKKNKNSNIEELLNWAKEEKASRLTIKYIPYIFIASTTIFIILAITNKIPATYLLLVFAINYLVVKLLTRNLSHVINMFIRNKSKVNQYSNLLSLIQDEQFKSYKLRELKRQLQSNDLDCKKEMKKLKNMISWMGDSVSNAYYLIINVLFLSDIFILNNLEEWKEKNGKQLENWLNIMGEVEALVSLSNLAFENPEWTYPTISAEKVIVAKSVGHPMLGKKAVVNNFSLNNEKRVALITGSNMSGKSTFLRTIGFNMVLSYLGLPTFSENFKCGIYNIYTCMRTEDNLEESRSSFYAEILRVKSLIDAGKRGEDVFFLLDEIFKGTNSSDRHDGAKILIDQLVKSGAVGLVSTHDLELCELEDTRKWLINFNFQEYYEDNKIKFDYKLRNGISKTHNAKHLMKLAGIEIS